MEDNNIIKEDVERLFTKYLEKKGQRRTPERYAIRMAINNMTISYATLVVK